MNLLVRNDKRESKKGSINILVYESVDGTYVVYTIINRIQGDSNVYTKIFKNRELAYDYADVQLESDSPLMKF